MQHGLGQPSPGQGQRLSRFNPRLSINIPDMTVDDASGPPALGPSTRSPWRESMGARQISTHSQSLCASW